MKNITSGRRPRVINSIFSSDTITTSDIFNTFWQPLWIYNPQLIWSDIRPWCGILQYFLVMSGGLKKIPGFFTMVVKIPYFFSILHSWPENIVKSQTSWYNVGSYLELWIVEYIVMYLQYHMYCNDFMDFFSPSYRTNIFSF